LEKKDYLKNLSSNRGKRGQTSHSNGEDSHADSKKVCIYCGITVHTEVEGYKKHGYPLGHHLYKAPYVNINNTITKIATKDRMQKFQN